MSLSLRVFGLIVLSLLIGGTVTYAEDNLHSIEPTKEKYYFSAGCANCSEDRYVLYVSIVDYKTGQIRTERIDIPIEVNKTDRQSSFFGLAYSSSRVVKKINDFDLYFYHELFEDNKKISSSLLKYNYKSGQLKKMREVKTSEGFDGTFTIFPNEKVYSLKRKDKEVWQLYSLEDNKYIASAKNMIFLYGGNSFSLYEPHINYGDLYYNYNRNSYKINFNGSIDPLYPWDKYSDENKQESFVRKVGSAQYSIIRSKDKVTAQFITKNQKKVILSEVTPSLFNQFSVSQRESVELFSPEGKYIVSYQYSRSPSLPKYFEVYETETGAKINTIYIPGNKRIDYPNRSIVWSDDSEEIVSSIAIGYGVFNLRNGVSVRRSYAPEHSYSNYTFNFELEQFMVAEDPIAIKIGDSLVQYEGQGTFFSSNGTAYAPLRDLMNGLQGSIEENNGKYIIKYAQKEMKLDKNKIMTWNHRVFYPLRDIIEGLKLRFQYTKTRTEQTEGGYKQFEIFTDSVETDEVH